MGWARKLFIDNINSLIQTLNLLGCCQIAIKLTIDLTKKPHFHLLILFIYDNIFLFIIEFFWIEVARGH
jgi:hypothetical protein